MGLGRGRRKMEAMIAAHVELQVLDQRLSAVLMALARAKGRNSLGLPRLTTRMVEEVRDGCKGGGIYKAMQRKLKKLTGRTETAAWLWATVARLQREHQVAVLAERRVRGRWKTCVRRANWREELQCGQTGGWVGLTAYVMRAVLRLEGAEEGGLVALARRNWSLLVHAVNKHMRERGLRTSLTLRVCLWDLAMNQGLLVEEQDSDPVVGGDWRTASWWDQAVKDIVEKGIGEAAYMVGLKERAMAWAGADKPLVRGDKEYLVDWCAGWPQVMRKVAAREGVEVVAVDNQAARLGQHALNVELDLCTVSPVFLKHEVAQQLGLKALQLTVDWAGVPCTTNSRNDASNCRVIQGKLQFNNYRKPQSAAEPQHPVGSEKGDHARRDDGLVQRLIWLLGRTSKAWALENPRGQLRKNPIMQNLQKHLINLDYCRFWSREERERGCQWQKMTCLWTGERSGEKWEPKGHRGKLLCERSCSCGAWSSKGGRRVWKHKENLEHITGLVGRMAMEREELKCLYPEELLTQWVQWAVRR